MAAPIEYRWDDANAPVARGERRSFHDIAHACLVTGYGSKPAAGWTREFVNATFDKAAFRPGAGTRFFLQVDSNTTANAYTHNLQGYEVMTSESSGTGPFNTLANPVTTNTSNAAGTTARPWVLIADAQAFYFFCWPTIASSPAPTSAQNDCRSAFFGDLTGIDTGDAYACALLGQYNGYSSLGMMQNPEATAPWYTSYAFFPRKKSAVVGGSAAWEVAGGGPGASGNYGYAGRYGAAYSSGSPIYISRPFINDAGAYTFRGFLPGYWYPCHPLAFGQLEQVPVNGKTMLSVRHYGYASTGYPENSFIDLGDWRA